MWESPASSCMSLHNRRHINDMRISEERYNSRIQALHFCLHNTIKTERIPINLYFRSFTHLILTDFFYLIRILLKIKRTIFICERHPLVPIIPTSMKGHKIYGTRDSQRKVHGNCPKRFVQSPVLHEVVLAES